MKAPGQGATIAKRRLARRLTELRTERGYTANQVCDRLNWGRGKVGRFEANSWVRPELSDIRDMLRLYDVSDTEQVELEQLAILARERAWWRDYADVFENEFPGYEMDAVRICNFIPLVVPGLLQMPTYMEAHMRVGPRSSVWRNRAVGARLQRQNVLSRTEPDPPQFFAVITEAALRYVWGAPADRRAQVAHLIGTGRKPNIEIRLLPFSTGPHPGMGSTIYLLEFPDDEPTLVFLENDVAIQEVSKADEVVNYIDMFDQIREAALLPEESASYLEKFAGELE